MTLHINNPARSHLGSNSTPHHLLEQLATQVTTRGSFGIRIFPAFHYLHSIAFISYTHSGARCCQRHFSRSRKCRLGTEKSKVTRGEQLDYQRTLVGSIFSVLTSRGGSLPSTMAIVMEDVVTESRPCMENHDRMLKELATPDVAYQPWCIQYPQLEAAQTYEFKSGLIHLLPKSHGLARENPHKHLKEFHVVCSTMRPQGILEDYSQHFSTPGEI
ncbi:hypothetical protein CR513_50240, partial [Mucuna pruriens]